MKRVVIAGALFFAGCGISDYQYLMKAAVSPHPTSVLYSYFQSKQRYYLTHPHAIITDFKRLQRFWKDIGIWPNPESAGVKRFVKYMQHYKIRSIIDFQKGYVRVESLINDKEKIKRALVYTMLMPEDPRSVDLYSDSISLNGKPFLYGEIMDNNSQIVTTKQQAEKYAQWLIAHRLKTYRLKNKIIYYVEFPLVKNSQNIRAKHYKPYVDEFSKKFGIKRDLVFGIIKVESDFNPYAVSKTGAIGLMQIIPRAAGVEGYKRVYGVSKVPSAEYLFVPKNNILIGTAYLNLVYYDYLKNISNPLTREYLTIASYNAGIGNVLKVFHYRKDRAVYIVNTLSPNEVYKRLVSRLPTEEMRNYLPKVLEARKRFIGF
ncbi:MAG: DUF3393 domain-containing protein [Epsilonproteobacteria bacterium]|nr:DUF3393 domain-containing protein [Campylobacterota bacterium]